MKTKQICHNRHRKVAPQKERQFVSPLEAPWHLGKCGERIGGFCIHGRHGTLIAEIPDSSIAYSNARLITTLPQIVDFLCHAKNALFDIQNKAPSQEVSKLLSDIGRVLTETGDEFYANPMKQPNCNGE